jgi:hypothetical protein
LSAQYNILPLALSDDHFILAKRGILIPPLRTGGIQVQVGRFSVQSEITADYSVITTTSFVDAGRFQCTMAVRCEKVILPPVIADAGKFTTTLAISLDGFAQIINLDVGRLSVTSTLNLENFIQTHIFNAGRFSLTHTLKCNNFDRLFIYVAPVSEKITYRCTLTGDSDGLDDLIFPISSFQSRLRSGTPTFCEVVIPGALDYITGIALRTNGDILVEMGIETPGQDTVYNEIVRVPFDDLSYDRGPRRVTARVSGHKTTTYQEPRTVSLKGVSVTSLQKNGLRRVRSEINFYTRPKDTVIWANESMVVGTIAFTVGTHTRQMDITEDLTEE